LKNIFNDVVQPLLPTLDVFLYELSLKGPQKYGCELLFFADAALHNYVKKTADLLILNI